MKVTLKDVASIKEGNIEIEENKLNIFYALNGTGKTSLTRAISTLTNMDEKEKRRILSNLRPYGTNDVPSIQCDKQLERVFIFDEKYISKNLFTESDTIRNTFEIVVNTENYEEKVEEIRKLYSALTDTVINNQFIKEFNEDINNIAANFMFTKTGKFNKTRSGFAQLNEGLVTERVPERNRFSQFVKNAPDAYEWKKWFDSGSLYEKGNDVCPYCGNYIGDDSRSAQNEIKEICDNKSVKKSLDALSLIHTLTKYLTEEQRDVIEHTIESGQPFDDETVQMIYEWFRVLEDENKKINEFKPETIERILRSVRDRKAVHQLKSLCLDHEVFKRMSFIPNAVSAIESVNDAINMVVSASTSLTDEMLELTRILANNIENNKDYVNKFLDNAGMPYEISIYETDGEYKTILQPKGLSETIDSPKENLSYGEMNALSLLLFSLDVRNQPADLIVLDDPISSFDNSKKYALMHQMFGNVHNQTNLRGKTVLMVTHDFQIVSDAVGKDFFKLIKKQTPALACAYYLRNYAGELRFEKINKKDIVVVFGIEKNHFSNTSNPVICRLIHFRRYLELTGDMDDRKYNVISSLMHGDPVPTYFGKPLAEANKMIDLIKKFEGMNDFDFYGWRQKLSNNDLHSAYFDNKRSNVEKVEIARCYLDISGEKNNYDRILISYLNSVCHIEDDLVINLDQAKFDTMPAHVIKFCDEIMDKSLLKPYPIL